MQRTVLPTLDEEQKLWKKGFHYVCGIDEVGRGAFAGPVVAAAVIFPQNFIPFDGVADSKLLLPRRREKTALSIKKLAHSSSLAEISASTINKVGIGKATQMAMRKAIAGLLVRPDFLLIDAFYIPYVKNLRRKNSCRVGSRFAGQKAIKHGDQKVFSIASASILAKVHRDKLMKESAKKYKVYSWGRNKGYGTKEHQVAIKKHGLTRLHRKVFVKNYG